MTITIAERQLDEKNRITVPASFASGLKGKGKVIVMSYDDQAVIITPDRRLADKLSDLLQRNEVNRKIRALEEWEKLIDGARLSKLTTEEIDRKVVKSILRPKNL